MLDAANSAYELQYHSVCRVLEELKAHEKPIVLALNKIDLLDEVQLKQISDRFSGGIPISAKNRLYLDRLVQEVHELIEKNELDDHE